MKKSLPNFAIVMPAYNEADCIKNVVLSWTKIAEKFNGILIIINDGSKDQTGKLLDELERMLPKYLRVFHKTNGGHGAAIRFGYEKALEIGVEWVFQTDSDDQFKPIDFPALWKIRKNYPFILGFRQNRQDPLHRKVISKIVRYTIFFVFSAKVKDSNIPYRLMHYRFLKEALQIIPPSVFAPNIFLSILGCRRNTFCEVPIVHEERKTGSISIVRLKLLKVCFRSLWELLQFRRSFKEMPVITAREIENQMVLEEKHLLAK